MSTKVWRYSEPSKNGEGWWIAFLDDAGCLSIQSDFGDYSYRWPMSGMPERSGQRIGLREFLLTVGRDYVLGKFASRTEFDAEGSLKNVRAEILDRRKKGEVDADWARAEWGMADRYLERARGSDLWISQTEIEEPWHLLASNGYPPQVLAFMDRVWPRIIEKIRADLNRERERLEELDGLS